MSCNKPFAMGGLRYVEKIGLILCPDDGCGGAIFIPYAGTATQYASYITEGASKTIGGRKMPAFTAGTALTAAACQAFDGATVLYNVGGHADDFAVFSNDSAPHAYRLISLINVPLAVLERGRWTADGVSRCKGCVVCQALATGSTALSNTFAMYGPIVHLNASEWKALKEAATTTS